MTVEYRGPIGREGGWPGANEHRLVIFLTDRGLYAEAHSHRVRRVLREYGDVAWAEYDLLRSDSKFPGDLLDLLTDEVLGPEYAGKPLPLDAQPRYAEVLFVAVRVGCLLAGDVCHWLWGRGFNGTIKAMLINPVHRRGIRWFPWRLVAAQPDLEEGVVDSQEYRAHLHHRQRLFFGMLWWEQTEYLLRHPLPGEGEFASVDAFVVRARPTDPRVRESAADAFIRAYRTVAEQAFTISELPEQPQAWGLAFMRMLGALYPKKG